MHKCRDREVDDDEQSLQLSKPESTPSLNICCEHALICSAPLNDFFRPMESLEHSSTCNAHNEMLMRTCPNAAYMAAIPTDACVRKATH